MNKTCHTLRIILALFLLSLATEQRLMAYADPGSGAMFVQIILAAIIGGLFRIRRLISRFRRPKNQPEPVPFPALDNPSLTRSAE
jgi:hypothetical protein